MAAPNATFFVWWAKYFECVWGGGWVQMALLIIYKVCVFGWGGVGDCLPNDVPRAMAARFFLTFIAKQNWIWKAISAT